MSNVIINYIWDAYQGVFLRCQDGATRDKDGGIRKFYKNTVDNIR